MKIYLASFVILVTSPFTHGLCLRAALTNDGTLTAGDGIPCSFGQFKRLLESKITNEGLLDCGSMSEELLDIFDEIKIRHVAQKIKASCKVAPEPSQSSTTSFREIFQSTELNTEEEHDRFLKEFYDGNTFINQHVGRGTGKIPSADISRFHKNSAKRTIVDWPGNNESFDNFDLSADSCNLNTVMCCWVTDRKINADNNNGNCKAPYPNKKTSEGSGCKDADPADNTDICYADHGRSPGSNHVLDGSFTIYPDDQEGDTHCHGFVFAHDENDESNLYKANNLFYVSMNDHLKNRGYVRNVPGAPMCGCIEKMPTVSRSDCTQTSHKYLYSFEYNANDQDVSATVTGRKVSFDQCDGETENDLESKYKQLADVSNPKIKNQIDEFNKYIVGRDEDDGSSLCPGAIDTFLTGYNNSRR